MDANGIKFLKEHLSEEEFVMWIKVQMLKAKIETEVNMRCVEFATTLIIYTNDQMEKELSRLDAFEEPDMISFAKKLFEGMKELDGYEGYEAVMTEEYNKYGFDYTKVTDLAFKILDIVKEMG